MAVQSAFLLGYLEIILYHSFLRLFFLPRLWDRVFAVFLYFHVGSIYLTDLEDFFFLFSVAQTIACAAHSKKIHLFLAESNVVRFVV